MFTTLKNRFEQGYRTCNYPKEKPAVFERYRGRPIIQQDVSPEMVKICANACPQDAIDIDQKKINMGRSLQLRQVSAGGCNACKADLNVLATPFFDLARFGINFVASPRHADGIVVTGPVSRNMKTALLKTYEAIPDPRVVIAVGSCTITGGLLEEVLR